MFSFFLGLFILGLLSFSFGAYQFLVTHISVNAQGVVERLESEGHKSREFWVVYTCHLNGQSSLQRTRISSVDFLRMQPQMPLSVKCLPGRVDTCQYNGMEGETNAWLLLCLGTGLLYSSGRSLFFLARTRSPKHK